MLPLLRSRSASQLTMRDAAAAACLSVGGLNHYFRPAGPAVLAVARNRVHCCQDAFARRSGELRERDPDVYFERFLASTVRAIVSRCTPSMQAAIELSADTFWDVMRDGMTPAPLIALLEETKGRLTDSELDRVTRGIRRAFLGATLDPRVTYEDLYDDVRRQLNDIRGPLELPPGFDITYR